jgi:hypothetical protein
MMSTERRSSRAFEQVTTNRDTLQERFARFI